MRSPLSGQTPKHRAPVMRLELVEQFEQATVEQQAQPDVVDDAAVAVDDVDDAGVPRIIGDPAPSDGIVVGKLIAASVIG